MNQPLLSVDHVSVHFSLPKKGGIFPWQKTVIQVLHNISFELEQGEILGVVGESGAGKSTLVRAITGLNKTSAGAIHLNGHTLTSLGNQKQKNYRRLIQMIFQDPLASLDPRMTLKQIISEPLKNYEPHLNKQQREERICEMIEKVGLKTDTLSRYPHEFSGGQCQRIGIARALVVRPQLLICDEATAALDVTIQAEIITLLRKLNREFNMAILMITHNLRLVSEFCHRLLVLKQGEIIEQGDTFTVFQHPKALYTQKLLNAISRIPA